ANHTQGKRAVGGKLFITNCRIAFAPNRLDAKMGGDSWQRGLSDLCSVGTDKPRVRMTEIFSGALRTRLVIHLKEGESQYFVVGKPEVVASEISDAIQQAEQGSAHQSTTAP
ncbi:MAG: hypothetical protein Q7Q71_10255, partial [Verrucomicrobiota bacterium JB023]|nr:hypothetical protein [Verrucomicrobiota bacterium JB023]